MEKELFTDTMELQEFYSAMEKAMPVQDVQRKLDILFMVILSSLPQREQQQFLQQLPAFISRENYRINKLDSRQEISSLTDLASRASRLDSLFDAQVFRTVQDAMITSIVLLNLLNNYRQNIIITRLLELEIL